MRSARGWILIGTLVVGLGCGNQRDSVIVLPMSPSTPVAAPVVPEVVAEFRVTGALVPVIPVIVRVSSSLDGLSQVTAVLPWSQRVNLGTRSNVFLSIEALGSGSSGFLHAGIYLDGLVFREGSSVGAWSPSVLVSGTYRR